MKAARAGNAAVSALGWFYAAAVVTAGTTTKMLPFSCPLRRSLRCGWQCAHPRDSPEPEPRARAPSPRMCRVTFAAQGIFPFLPKDGTRIHRNHSSPWICPYLCEIPAGPSRAVSIPHFHNPLEHPALGRPCLDSRRWATAAEGKLSYHLLGVCSRRGCLSLG